MPFSRDSAIQALFARTLESASNAPQEYDNDKTKRSVLHRFGRLVGYPYSYFLAKRIAKDRQLAASIHEYMRQSRERSAVRPSDGNPCVIRICSTQKLGRLFELFPPVFLDGVKDEIADRLRTFFPKKGDAPRPDIGFNYYISDVIFEYFDHYGGFYYQRNRQVDIVFQIEIPDADRT